MRVSDAARRGERRPVSTYIMLPAVHAFLAERERTANVSWSGDRALLISEKANVVGAMKN
jgi:hypothetical protein